MPKFIIKPTLLFVPLFCLGCLLASNARSDESGFYASVAESLYVIGLPEYAPVYYRTYKVAFDRAEPVMNNIIAAPLTGITLGWRTDHQLFFEAYGELASTKMNSKRKYNHRDDLETTSFSFPSGEITSYYAVVDVQVDTDLWFQQYGGELTAGWSCTRNDTQISPFVGYWFMHLTQDYNLTWQSLTHIVSNEKVESTYHGLLVGLKASHASDDWDFETRTTLGAAWVRNEYLGHMSVTGSTREEWYPVAVNIGSIRGTLELAVSRAIGEGWRAGLNLEGRMLTYVPGIVSSTKSPDETNGVAADIKGEATVSGKLGLELSYSF